MNKKGKKQLVPVWEKYMLTVQEASQYFGIGEKKIRGEGDRRREVRDLI